MSTYVFVGPTLTNEDVEKYPDFIYLPPVAQGDVYKIACETPHAIGIIDGYFSGVPSVWHKEILWVMERGIHVFGGASMGALRAAELHVYGMQGVGEIFQFYVDGTLEDDDEVALVHGPEETDFIALSEPMVNIRATLRNAEKQQIITDNCCGVLIDAAKNVFYPERTWEQIITSAKEQGLHSAEIDALNQWLPDNRIDLKRSDALEMLAKMSDVLEQEISAPTPSFQFEWTQVWDSVISAHSESRNRASAQLDLIIDELRLQDDVYRTTRHQALLRHAANKKLKLQNAAIDGEQVSRKKNEFRTRHGLMTRKHLDQYLHENDLDEAQWTSLVEEHARLQQLLKTIDLDNDIIAVLKLNGQYKDCASRARQKQAILDESDNEAIDVATTGLSPPRLLQWFFKVKQSREIPHEIGEYIESLGLPDRKAFYRLLAREYVYLLEQNAATKEHQEERENGIKC